MGITSTSRGFTIVELLIVIVVIGILAAITIVAYNGIQDRARTTKMRADLSNISKSMKRLEIDTGSTVFGCQGGNSFYGPEGFVSSANTGLLSAPTVGTTTETCTWSSQLVDSWKGPYLSTQLLDPWGRSYYIDLDYFLCEGGNAKLIAAAVSYGQNGSINYPTSATTGACTVVPSDDTYLELWRS